MTIEQLSKATESYQTIERLKAVKTSVLESISRTAFNNEVIERLKQSIESSFDCEIAKAKNEFAEL